MKETIYYRLAEYDGDFEPFDTAYQTDSDLAAEDAARNYYHDGGYDSPWPLTFILYDTEGGPEVARFRVEVKTEPTFHAVSA